MKKRLTIGFFSICFLAAVITEAYFIQAESGNLFSVAGIGLVVLITGYLLFDSIRSKLVQSTKDMRFYLDQYLREETYKWDERFTEANNLWKATYTATKKNSAALSGQLEGVLQRIDRLEDNTTRALQTVAELQKKSLEGQKNALNYEINHNKENTRQIIKALHEAGDHTASDELWSKLLSSMEKNNELLETQVSTLNQMLENRTFERTPDLKVSSPQEFREDFYEELDSSDQINEEDTFKGIEDWDLGTITGMDTVEENTWSTGEEENTPDISPDLIDEAVPEAMDLNFVEDLLPSKEAVSEPTTEEQSTITPLYDDPNKKLSADEIAALFASFGQ